MHQTNDGLNHLKLLIVVDHRDWAFSFIAKNVQNVFGEDNSTTIYTEDFLTYGGFLKAINLTDFDVIFFFSRKYLFGLIDYIAIYNRKNYPFITDKCILTTIPDHAFSSEIILNNFSPYFELIDGYITTNHKLFKHYSDRNLPKKPYSVIFDQPHLEYKPVTSAIKKRQGETCKIIWIGNSNWGSHYGVRDYKGLETIIKPALKMVSEKGLHYELDIFDNAEKKYSKSTIDRALIDSDILLCASIEEGTPLPVIEAMAYGCAIVSTDVGIVNEVFDSCQQDFIVERSTSAFSAAISKLLSNPRLLYMLKDSNIQQYKIHFSDNNYNSWKIFITDSCVRNKYLNRSDNKNSLLIKLSKNTLLASRFSIFYPYLKKTRIIKEILRIFSR